MGKTHGSLWGALLCAWMLTVCGSSATAAYNLGLLVKSTSSLDTEEQAAYNFAASRGFNVIALDSAAIVANPAVLGTCSGFWAANNSEPKSFNNPTIISALRVEIENHNKGLLITWYGNYMAQYLGLGTAYPGGSWSPAVSDHEYWIDKIDAHPVFENIASWIPPVGPPDDQSKLLWYATPGYIPIGNISINWSVPVSHYYFAHIWASYGWCHQSPDPVLCAEYGITCTCERGVSRACIYEARVGTGSVMMGPNSMAGADHWNWGPLGYQLLENMIGYVCAVPPPIQGTISDGITHNPLEEALVEALRGGVTIDSVQTLPNGQYAFYDLPSGDYVIRARKSGFETATSDLLHYSRTNTVLANLFLWPLASQTAPDLFVLESDITWTVLQSGALTVTAMVHNGGMTAQNVTVRLLDEDMSSGRSVTTQIESDRIIPSLAAGGAESVSASWVPTSSYHRIHVIVDPDNAVAETNEANNAASRLLGAVGRTPPRVVSVRAKWDGDPRQDVMGQFLAGVEGEGNTFYADVEDDDRDVERVEFTFCNTTLIDSTGSDGWSVDFDTGTLPGEDVILMIVARDAAGLVSGPRLATIDMVPKPDWMNTYVKFAPCGVGGGIGFENGYFKFIGELNPPGSANICTILSFQHSFPPDMFMLGGKENSFNGAIEIQLWWPLYKTLGPKAKGSFTMEQEFLQGPLCGSGRRYWDESVQQCRDAVTGLFLPSDCCGGNTKTIEFELTLNPDLTIEGFRISGEWEQKLLSVEYTQLVPIQPPALYGVLGIGLDIFGRLGLALGAENDLQAVYIEPSIGASAQINGTLGIDVALLARFEFIFSPRLNLDYSLRFESPGGTTGEGTGTWEVRWTIQGCILWGTMCGEIASGAYGPYDLSHAYPAPLPNIAGTPKLELTLKLPDPIAFPALRKGPYNRLGLVWIRDVDPDTSRVDTEVYWAWADSSGVWSDAIPVTGGGGSDGLFQLNPTLAFEPSGKAVAVWTQNSLSEGEAGSGTLTLSQVLDRQDIYWARWDGTSWSSPSPLMADSTEPYRADGLPAIDIGNYGQGLVVWDRCVSDSSLAQGDREILYAVYDSSSGTFEEPEVPEDAQITHNDVDDYSPVIAYRSDGYAEAVWLRDVPGTGPMGACENEVVAMTWDGDSWSDFRVLASGSGMYRSPSVTCLPWGYALATWVVLQVAEEDSSAVYTIEAEQWYFGPATPRPVQLRAFQSPQVVYRSPFQIETPVVQVDARNIAAIVWRGHNGFDGDLFCSVKDLESYGNTWTEPDTLTNDDLTDWMLTAAIDDQNNLHFVDLKSDLSGSPGLANRGTFLDGLSIGSRGIQCDLTLSDELNFGFRPMAADLKIVADSFTVSSLYAAEGDSVVVSAFVRNIGDATTPGSDVRFYDGDPDSGGVVIGADVSIGGIPPGTGVRASHVWVASSGIHEIYAIVDPTNSIPEQNKSNNSGFMITYCVPNLSVDTVLISDNYPSPGADVTLQAIVRNAHGTSSPADTLVFFVADTILAKRGVEPLAVGARDTCVFTLAAPVGKTVLAAFVDYDSTLLESDETDNGKQLILPVMPDLVVCSDSISCAQLDSLTYRYLTVLHNAGGVNAESVWVYFFDGAPLLAGAIIDSALVTWIPARSGVSVSMDWQAPIGLTTLFVVADYRDRIAEGFEDNNEGHRSFISSVMPELAITQHDISFGTSDRMTFHFVSTVHNSGRASAPAVRVRFYDVPDSVTVTEIGARIIPVLEDSSLAVVTFVWTRPDTLARFVRVWVDRDSLIAEANRGNNWADIYVASPTSVEKVSPVAPSVVTLDQNYPNPFNGVTTIRYGLPADGQVRLTLYDVSGRPVALLVDRRESAGYHVAVWDGRNQDGRPVSSGVYFYCLETERVRTTRKLVFLR